MTADDTLQLQRCSACARLRWPPMPACPACFGEAFELVAASGTGTLWTFTVAYRAQPAYQAETPFAVGIVALDEAPELLRVQGRIVDCPVEDVRIGMRLRVIPPASAGERFEFHPIRD